MGNSRHVGDSGGKQCQESSRLREGWMGCPQRQNRGKRQIRKHVRSSRDREERQSKVALDKS